VTKAGAELRLRRLLAAVPWIVGEDGPTVEEVCARFGFTEKALASDIDLLMMCGVEPFTPDTMIEAYIDDGRVFIKLPGWFSRPMRLTRTEALALVSAATALAAVPGVGETGPLARGIEKVAAALGLDLADLDIELGPADPEVLSALRQAESARRQVRMDYYAYGRDEWGTRVIEPHRVFASNPRPAAPGAPGGAGKWYVSAYCHKAQEERLFRIDRIRDVVLLDTTFEPRPIDVAGAVFHPRPEHPVVTLEIEPDARWVLEAYPNEGVQELGDGRARLTLRITEQAWLARLLLRLGPDGRVVEGDGQAGRDAATRLLERYRAEPASR
jgi:proteasome accessory factor C